MKQIIVIIMSLGMTINVVACDICGCSAGTFGMGILPDFRAKTFGINSFHRTFRSTHPILFADEQPIVANDEFLSFDLFARLPLYKSLQAQVNVPFVHASQDEHGQRTTRRGLGDISLGFNYLFAGGQLFTYQLSLGVGVKTPTGKWNDEGESSTNVNLMPGTGSTDFNASINGIVRYKAIGLLLQSHLTKTSENDQQFKFGNRFEAIGRLMTWIKLSEDFNLIPHVGASLMIMDPNQQYTRELDLTGGEIQLLRFGIDGYYKNWGIQTQLAVPISQNLSEGYVEQQQWSHVSLLYFISRK
ncbi:MAG: hypothetical protein GC193_04565 [Cryomorphaceae bacterium]|nr:hypothetical protein [Cryomorphaceae bacterium]